MTNFIAALPMYDWPEMRTRTDAQWATLRDALRGVGIDAPDTLTRTNADMPAAPGGIHNSNNVVIAPDPATLPPEKLDFHTLWRHPALLFGQTCWGPMELGLGTQVRVIGQPDYSAYAGGEGPLYSSAIIMRKSDVQEIEPAVDARAILPLAQMRGARFAYNGPDSMSGIIALTRDLEAASETLDIFSEKIVSGSHRASVVAVAEGRVDICTIDCRSWDLIQRFEPSAGEVQIVGWTARRKGLPFIASAHLSDALLAKVRQTAIETALALPFS